MALGAHFYARFILPLQPDPTYLIIACPKSNVFAMVFIDICTLLAPQLVAIIFVLYSLLISQWILNRSANLETATQATATALSDPNSIEKLSQNLTTRLAAVVKAVNAQAGAIDQLDRNLETMLMRLNESMRSSTRSAEEKSERILDAVRDEAIGIVAELTELGSEMTGLEEVLHEYVSDLPDINEDESLA